MVPHSKDKSKFVSEFARLFKVFADASDLKFVVMVYCCHANSPAGLKIWLSSQKTEGLADWKPEDLLIKGRAIQSCLKSLGLKNKENSFVRSFAALIS